MPPTALERKVEQIAASLEGDDGMRVRLALVEQELREHRTTSAERHDQVMERLDGLSLPGRTPKPAETAKGTGRWQLPISGDLATKMGQGMATVILSAVVGFFAARSGGAVVTQAVEDAVEHGQAVPVAPPPTIRVLPVPIPVPFPVPTEAEPPSDDLLPDPR